MRTFRITVRIEEAPLTDPFRLVRDAANKILDDLSYNGDVVGTVSWSENDEPVSRKVVGELER